MRRFPLSRRTALILACATVAPFGVCFGIAMSAPKSEQPFLADSEKSMRTMMADMAVRPTGDTDADFAAMMIPHHRGAIDMAKAELQYGTNEQLRRIAQEMNIAARHTQIRLCVI